MDASLGRVLTKYSPLEKGMAKLGLVLMDVAMLSKYSIQFSVDGRGCVLSLSFDLRTNYGRGDEDSSDLFQKFLSTHGCIQCR